MRGCSQLRPGLGHIRPNFGRSRPNSGRLCPQSAKVGRLARFLRHLLVELRQSLHGFDQLWLELGCIWPNFGSTWPGLDQTRVISADGRRSKLDLSWMRCTKNPEHLSDAPSFNANRRLDRRPCGSSILPLVATAQLVAPRATGQTRSVHAAPEVCCNKGHPLKELANAERSRPLASSRAASPRVVFLLALHGTSADFRAFTFATPVEFGTKLGVPARRSGSVVV